jgi:predicted glycogen debranching enzyme
MEWLETDGLGGFAMGSSVGVPMRRYHSLLTTSISSPAQRFTLINGIEAFLYDTTQRVPLSSLQFNKDLFHPHGLYHIESFVLNPWPTWTYSTPLDVKITFQLFMCKNTSAVFLCWKTSHNQQNLSLHVRPLLTGRSYHALHFNNSNINLDANVHGQIVAWQPYSSLPKIHASTNASYQHSPLWIENVFYEEDHKRGSECHEDLASPGVFQFDLSKRNAYMIFSTTDQSLLDQKLLTEEHFNINQAKEAKRRQHFITPLEKASDHYIVSRGKGKTIIAGYPWFADWGRDSFISVRGLCLATDRIAEAEEILLEWSKTTSKGMLPNRFLDEDSGEPEYNSVDASLWYVIAAFEFLNKNPRKQKKHEQIEACILEIIENYKNGTRYNIKCDQSDGLLSAGCNGLQLTWMDAKVGDYVVTPRIGKPVEIQALWINALAIAKKLFNIHHDLFETARKSFQEKFWNHETSCLYDVIDNNHEKGARDSSIRPNQILAVGGLPLVLVDEVYARKIVETIEQTLLTPFGLRTLDEKSVNYCAHYSGDQYHRDRAYHQGTVWSWLMGPFIEAWVRVRGSTPLAKAEAKKKFFEPLLASLNQAGLGHLSEIHDGQAPHVNRGCPFQAWSVAEALRVERSILI